MVNLLTIPSLSWNFTCFKGPKALVRMSTVWSSVGQYCSWIVPSSTSCLMKWQCASHMFGTFVEDWILGKFYHPLIVTPQRCWLCFLHLHIWKHPLELYYLTWTFYCSSIFYFCRWKGYCMLFLAGPCDYTRAKAEYISKGGFSVINKTCLIWICISTQPRVFASVVPNAKAKCPFHIS